MTARSPALLPALVLTACLDLAALFPTESSALAVPDGKAGYQYFRGGWCEPDERMVGIPFDTRGVRVLSPKPSSLLNDRRGSPVAQVTDVQVGRHFVTWEVTPLDCTPGSRWQWETRFYNLRFSFERVIRLRKRDVERAARKIMQQRFSFWSPRNAYAIDERCRGKGPRYRCKLFFGAGDVYYQGRMRLRTRVKLRRADFVGRWRVKQVNEYCIFVHEKPRRACTKRIRGGGKFLIF